MKKPVKLAFYLLVCAALVFLFWARADCPRLSAESALRRIESLNLEPKSAFLTAVNLGQIRSNSGNYQRYLAAGVTDTYLHMAEVRNRVWLWYCNHNFYRPLVSVPLEDGPVAGIAPDDWPFDYTFFLYTPQPMELWVATLTIGDVTYTTEGQTDPSGFTLFRFPQLEDCEEAVGNNLKAHAYDMLNMGYNEDSKTMDISLSVALFDTSGQPVGFAAREYPAS